MNTQSLEVPEKASRVALRALLFGELWERFSFYGMRSLLLLYALKGLSHSQPEASRIYGIYMASAFLGPSLGGMLGDSRFGRKRVMMAGALLMLAGHAMMAFEHRLPFYVALALVAVGCGAFKPNITALLSSVYAPNDERRDRAFLSFYATTCIGAALAPLVCGFLAEKFGYGVGFSAAAGGMGIAILLLRWAWPVLDRDAAPVLTQPVPQSPVRGLRLADLKGAAIVSAFAVFFWVAAEQAGNTLTLFADQNMDRTVRLGPWLWTLPASTLLAINPVAVLVLMPLLGRWWKRAAARGTEQTTSAKMATGLGVMGVAFAVLGLATWMAAPAGKVGIVSLVLFYVIASASELFVLPSGMSLVTKLTPPSRRGAALGPWFLAGFIGNLIAGRVGEAWQYYTPTTFFTAVAVFCGFGAVGFWLAHDRLERIVDGAIGSRSEVIGRSAAN